MLFFVWIMKLSLSRNTKIHPLMTVDKKSGRVYACSFNSWYTHMVLPLSSESSRGTNFAATVSVQIFSWILWHNSRKFQLLPPICQLFYVDQTWWHLHCTFLTFSSVMELANTEPSKPTTCKFLPSLEHPYHMLLEALKLFLPILSLTGNSIMMAEIFLYINDGVLLLKVCHCKITESIGRGLRKQSFCLL